MNKHIRKATQNITVLEAALVPVQVPDRRVVGLVKLA